MTFNKIAEHLHGLVLLDENADDIFTFDDTPHIQELNRLTLQMMWNQNLICFCRFNVNDLMYNGHYMTSPEVSKVGDVIEKLLNEEANLMARYSETLLKIEDGEPL